jgi:ribonuclease Z
MFGASGLYRIACNERTSSHTMEFIQVLGTDTGDSFPSVLAFFDRVRYLFNVGEGVQRYCTEHKVRLRKVREIFLTRLSPRTVGGLPGLLMTLADIGVEHITIHGPKVTSSFP